MSDEPDNRPPSFDDLEARIRQGRDKAGLGPKPADAGPRHQQAAGRGLHASIEFVVNTLVGAGLGYGAGYFAGVEVIGLVLGMFLGFAAGLRRMIRTLGADSSTDEERNGNGRDAD